MNKSKSILITGCSTGIGLYTAQELQRLGYQVYATARKTEDVEHLKQLGLNAYQLDLNDSLSIKNTVIRVLDKTNGELYALFNNGGFGIAGAVEDLTKPLPIWRIIYGK